MKTNLKAVPRTFSPTDGLTIKDMGDVVLEDYEQLTFRTGSGKANDVSKMSWGFYLGNSINWSLKRQGFKTALVLSRYDSHPKLFINLVEQEKLEDYRAYLAKNKSEVVAWLDEWFAGKP